MIKDLSQIIRRVVRDGSWMVRADEDGVSYKGFRWPLDGSWIEASDWSERPDCGGGLHGQTRDWGGYIIGNTLRFVETEGPVTRIGFTKGKVRRARILLTNCLPGGLVFDGSLSVAGCKGLRALPTDLSVRRDLILDTCYNLRHLPVDLSVGGHLHMSYCHKLASLPDKLFVGKSLWATGCSALEGLPRTFFIGEDVYLDSCCRLRTLPDGLFVKGNLGLRGCRSLERLPKGLIVTGVLRLAGCDNIQELPGDLRVDSAIQLEDNQGGIRAAALAAGFRVCKDL